MTAARWQLFEPDWGAAEVEELIPASTVNRLPRMWQPLLLMEDPHPAWPSPESGWLALTPFLATDPSWTSVWISGLSPGDGRGGRAVGGVRSPEIDGQALAAVAPALFTAAEAGARLEKDPTTRALMDAFDTPAALVTDGGWIVAPNASARTLVTRAAPPRDVWQAALATAPVVADAPRLRLVSLEFLKSHPGSDSPTRSGLDRLTVRQRQVLDLVLKGYSNNAISAALGCRPATVEVHVSAVLRAAGARSRAELIARECHSPGGRASRSPRLPEDPNHDRTRSSSFDRPGATRSLHPWCANGMGHAAAVD